MLRLPASSGATRRRPAASGKALSDLFDRAGLDFDGERRDKVVIGIDWLTKLPATLNWYSMEPSPDFTDNWRTLGLTRRDDRATPEIWTMRARVRKLLGWSICLAGALLALAGLWGIAIYVWGVGDVWGEPDTSWIFWGLVFLMWGLIFLGVGAGMVIAGLQILRR